MPSPKSPLPHRANVQVGDEMEAKKRSKISDDWLAVACATLLLTVAFAAVWTASSEPRELPDRSSETVVANPLASWLGKPSSWKDSPLDAFVTTDDAGVTDFGPVLGVTGVFTALALLLTLAVQYRDGTGSGLRFFKAFVWVFLLATIAYTLAAQSVVKAYNLEYALWALMVGLLISNTVGTPTFLRPAIQTEFFIKTGLVLLGAEVLMSRLMALGVPGVFVAWVVTPIVLISTYVFGQKIIKMESRSLNMVISADMSVCGVSAAIASAAACKAKKEELSLAIGMSLSFTVVMMIALPAIIKLVEMDEVLGGAWLGGTIDSTGAVAAAGATLGDRGLEVAATVKMIQNILIGVSAFGIATYWVTKVEADPNAARPDAMEIWRRFPKFVIGFVLASVVFSILHATLADGPALVDSMIKGSTKTFRGWFFCLAFVSIGLETSFRDLMPYFRGGKPLLLYLCGQTLNLVLTLLMAWLMFHVVFKDFVN